MEPALRAGGLERVIPGPGGAVIGPGVNKVLAVGTRPAEKDQLADSRVVSQEAPTGGGLVVGDCSAQVVPL